MHTGGVEGWKKSKYEYRDQLEVRTETSSFLTRMLYKLFQELVATTPTSRDWNGIFISILVIASIIGRKSSNPCFLIKVTWHSLHLHSRHGDVVSPPAPPQGCWSLQRVQGEHHQRGPGQGEAPTKHPERFLDWRWERMIRKRCPRYV